MRLPVPRPLPPDQPRRPCGRPRARPALLDRRSSSVTDTTCPSCDAPAPARARSCARCGYRFYEDGGPAAHLPRPDRMTLTLGAAATAIAIAVIAAALLLAGGGG